MWILAGLLVTRDCRSECSVEKDRMSAKMVFEDVLLSCRSNSRPRPRLAPVRTQFTIAFFLPGSFFRTK